MSQDSNTEKTLNQLTMYDLFNFIDKESTKIDLERGSIKMFAMFLRFPSPLLADRIKTWMDWYVGFNEDLPKVKIIEVDKKLMDFIKSPEFQKIINSTEPIMSLQDELNAINKEKHT